MDLNKVMLIGRSTTDVEIKKIESTGSSVVNFSLATNRRYKNKDEQVVEESEYHRCVAYGNGADIIGKYVSKGKRMYVEGRLRTRKWEDTNGNARYTTEIVVDNFIFLDSKPSEGGDDGHVATDSGASNVPPMDDDLPF
jgi:single-strand DNA-binding protein